MKRLFNKHLIRLAQSRDISVSIATRLLTEQLGELSYTGLFISPSGTSELDCATTKTDTAERSISIGRESLKIFFVLGALAYLQVPPLGGSRDEKWRAQWIKSVMCLGICQNWVNCDGATEVSDHVPHRTIYGQNNSRVAHEIPAEWLPVRCRTKRPAGAIGLWITLYYIFRILHEHAFVFGSAERNLEK